MYQSSITTLSDQQIAHGILSRDTRITTEYLYKKCYPLFKSVYDKYYTDCRSVIELINEIYAYIIIPDGETDRSKLQDFCFRCSLPLWLKIITEKYCHQLFVKNLSIGKFNNPRINA